jgi:hypothetical protein
VVMFLRPMTCGVDLATKGIRFIGCGGHEAMIGAAEKRLAVVTGQLSAKTGLTNRERRVLNRERNLLSYWLMPERDNLTRAGDARYARRKKATMKKLLWLARKLDRIEIVGTRKCSAN